MTSIRQETQELHCPGSAGNADQSHRATALFRLLIDRAFSFGTYKQLLPEIDRFPYQAKNPEWQTMIAFVRYASFWVACLVNDQSSACLVTTSKTISVKHR